MDGWMDFKVQDNFSPGLKLKSVLMLCCNTVVFNSYIYSYITLILVKICTTNKTIFTITVCAFEKKHCIPVFGCIYDPLMCLLAVWHTWHTAVLNSMSREYWSFGVLNSCLAFKAPCLFNSLLSTKIAIH